MTQSKRVHKYIIKEYSNTLIDLYVRFRIPINPDDLFSSSAKNSKGEYLGSDTFHLGGMKEIESIIEEFNLTEVKNG